MERRAVLIGAALLAAPKPKKTEPEEDVAPA